MSGGRARGFAGDSDWPSVFGSRIPTPSFTSTNGVPDRNCPVSTIENVEYPLRFAKYMSFRALPCHVASQELGSARVVIELVVRENWKCHFSFPVSASSATTLLLYRLSPLVVPVSVGTGLPTPNTSGSTRDHMNRPARSMRRRSSTNRLACLESGSPGPGMRLNRHLRFPLRRRRRQGNRGGRTRRLPPHDDFVLDHEWRRRKCIARLGPDDGFVPEQFSGLRVDSNHVDVDRAHDKPVSMNCDAAVKASAAGPRCCDGLYAYVQNGLPVTASRAMMSFGGWTIYMIPSTTSGVTSNLVLVGSREFQIDRSTLIRDSSVIGSNLHEVALTLTEGPS